ncbi:MULTISPECIES: phosphoglycolate phosphatase [Pseudomonas]|jgi:phosphoglycolate phosphatase|uniref:Phosphoglycolate phosphatase n=1 Tax=Pseudomonas chlororaphis TaxID=587753 RepID=A0AB34BYB5_9PSED|nr:MULTISPECIES: phosphoglycolate phosphatase [Pseudomonas]AZD04838.1 Phosphoglycolate phosphatase [Pseudomonas chlororaphis subsp. chlororaphis]AZD18379.1 Phosphoglycolate phosphatase [Pseudomonas chlororaphis]KAA5835858.1 phosphoglycolate phosphatase [Pseudomonas chlororaphis]MBM0285401.1 phosphoglycolate phosphatase [Pseudomonas chlororaphis]MCP1482403.1 phosphoglycolate phosphatase [Pseudomonas chlororaphis]
MSGFEQLFPGRLPRLVMFDLDGTLVDSVPDLAAAVDDMLLKLGRPPAGIEAVREWVGNGVQMLVRRALANDIAAQGVDDVEAERGLELFNNAYEDGHELTVVYPGVRDTLKWLHKQGVEMALITNKPERFVAPLLDQMKIGRYFRWIIGGDTLPQKKPDPAALFFVMKMASIPASQSLFVGDSRSDVQAAKAAGVKCVALSYGYNHGRPIAEEMPALVIDDLRQLIPGCLDPAAEITLPDAVQSPPGNAIVVVTRKLWMKVIKALARWRWRA